MDRLKEILDFVEAEILAVKSLKYSEFSDGMIAGLSLVRGYLKSQIEWEGKQIAEALNK